MDDNANEIDAALRDIQNATNAEQLSVALERYQELCATEPALTA